jgi:Rrf2 family protein
VKISAKTEYACLAVLELAARFASGAPAPIRAIADTHNIPATFLVQILLQLKAAGIVASTRGASGGYQLTRDPREISLAEVMAIVEGPPASAWEPSSPSPLARALAEAWNEAAGALEEKLGSITFADLRERAGAQDARMYYI